jgi:hypothetical protein
MDIERPSPAKRVEITTQIRKPVIFEASLNNPENEEVVFEVISSGDGLIGDSYFSIPPKSQKTYEIMFLPLKA